MNVEIRRVLRRSGLIACAMTAAASSSAFGRAAPATIVDGSAIARNEPPPHGETGTSTVRRFTGQIDDPRLEVRERWLYPGSLIGEHVLTHDQIFYVTEGSADLAANGVVHNLSAGDMLYAFDRSVVSVRPYGREPAKILMVWPNADPQTKPLAPLVQNENGLAREEPAPWGNVGMTRGYDIFPPFPGHHLELRKRTYLPGSQLGRHEIHRDTLFYILSGEGMLALNGVQHELKPGISAYVPRRNEIEVRQSGSEPLSLLMVWPAAGMGTRARPAVLANEAAIATREPPHGGVGMSVASSLTGEVEGRTVEMRKRVLLRGARMAPYTIPRDQALLVLEGEGELTADGMTTPFGLNQFAYLREGSNFSLKQVGSRPLSIMMMWALGEDRSSKVAWGEDVLEQNAGWYSSADARAMADAVLQYQSPQGGWPKNTDLSVVPAAASNVPGPNDGKANTFDNEATTLPLEFLARMVHATGDERYREAFIRGLDYTLAAQYPNGGWPQYFPLRQGYYSNVTFNDDVMARIMNLLRDVASGKPPHGFVDETRRRRAAEAVRKGTDLILRTQIVQNGKRTGWAAQYDVETLEPAWARRFEPPSLSGNETVGIVRYLMSIERPSPPIVAAIEGAIDWFRRVRIENARIETFIDGNGDQDRRMVSEQGAGPIWARFYELGTNRSVFMGRESVARYRLADIERERRGGYHYLGTWPQSLLQRDYSAWRERIGRPLAE